VSGCATTRTTPRAKADGRWQAALERFTRAHTLDPDDPSALHCRGHVYQELGEDVLGRADLERAITLYSEMLVSDPESDEGLFWRGAARARLGERDAALADLAAAIAIDGDRRDEARGEEDFKSFAADPVFVRLTAKS
jgi:tetratricopeptide (TPR) repeat protein